MLRRRLSTVLAVVLVCTVSAWTAGVASADTHEELREQRQGVRQDRGKTAKKVDVLSASRADLMSKLGDLNANVAVQRAAVANARSVAEQTYQLSTQARAAEHAAAQRLAATRLKVRQQAVDAYVMPTSDESAFLSAVTSDDIDSAMRRHALLSFRAEQGVIAVDQLNAAREELDQKRVAAEEAATAAAGEAAAVEKHLSRLKTAQGQQRRVALRVNHQVRNEESHARHLASLDAQLSSQIVAEQQRMATLAAQSAAAARAVRSVSADGLHIVRVRDIWVNARIANQVAALLNAADRAGIRLSGWGYRSAESQIALRRQNCGTSHYAVYEMPASQCSPPTAPPGYSMHEVGLAIDFTCFGGSISTRSNICFRWLAANASNYGLYNLPSEPWHWSTNGH